MPEKRTKANQETLFRKSGTQSLGHREGDLSRKEEGEAV